MMEYIIDRISIAMDHASVGLVNERAIPPVTKKADISQPGRRVQLELGRHFVEMGELILFLVNEILYVHGAFGGYVPKRLVCPYKSLS